MFSKFKLRSFCEYNQMKCISVCIHFTKSFQDFAVDLFNVVLGDIE